MNRLVTLFVAGFIALMLLSSTIFVVDQRRFAIVFALGQVRDVITEPGLHFKLPPPFQNVIYLDKRILTLDTPDADRFITAEKKNILVDAFVKWRIVDPRLYYVSFSGDERAAANRMSQIIKAALNDEITKRTVREVISGERGAVMLAVQNKVVAEAKQIGIGIVDVRLKRVDYIEQINASVYDRMRAERVRVANELRSTGSAESEKIRADADRQRTVILAEAFRATDHSALTRPCALSRRHVPLLVHRTRRAGAGDAGRAGRRRSHHACRGSCAALRADPGGSTAGVERRHPRQGPRHHATRCGHHPCSRPREGSLWHPRRAHRGARQRCGHGAPEGLVRDTERVRRRRR